MQRRNVDLPDPDGPSRHITSPRLTSRLMPLRTSRRPKRLWTPSALTMSSAIRSHLSPAGQAHPPGAHRRLLGAAEAAAVTTLDEVLADIEDAGHHQVPEHGDDQQRDLLVVDRVDELH